MNSSPLQQRRLSPTLQKYVATSFLIPYACALVGFFSIFFLNDVLDNISDFVKYNVPFKDTLLFYLAKQPQNVVNIVPISCSLAASFMTLNMGRRNELTAMRAAGLSLFTCTLPVWITATLSCLAVFAVNESWGPSCAKLANHIESQYFSNKLEDKRASFYHPKELRDWSIEQLSLNAESHFVSVRQYRPDGTSRFFLTAQKASYTPDTGWTFQNGHIQFYDETGNKLVGHQEFFSQKIIKFTESPKEIASHSLTWETMNIQQLRTILNAKIIDTKRARATLKALIWNRLTFPLASLIAALFGVAFTIATDRMGLMRGFACAIGGLVIFYIFSQFMLVTAKHGWIPSFWGGAFPNLAFLAAAFATMWKKQ